MEFKTTGRNGALTEFRIVGGADNVDNMPETGYSYRMDGSDIVGKGSKKDINLLASWVERVNLINAKSESPDINSNAPDRVMVEAGKYRIGDKLGGHVITGLGREWRPNADDYSANGIHPGVDFVQYAYFK